MSRNGSGVYSLPAGNPVVTGTTITSSWANNTLTDIATALTGSVASDGQTAMTGALNMGTNKITNIANGTAATDAVAYGQLSSFAPATTGSSVLAGNGSGGFTNVTLATGLSYSSGTLTADINNLVPSQTGNAGKVLSTNGSVVSWNTAGAAGTVTSVALSGGTTGLTVSGSPITTSGTITLAGTLAVANGGTGATTANGAVTNLLPSQSGNSGKFLTTNGTNTSWSSAGTGTVTSVGGTGSGLGFSLSGTVTSSGNITLTVPSASTLASNISAATLSGNNSMSGSNTFSGTNSFTNNNTHTITQTFGSSTANTTSTWAVYARTPGTAAGACVVADASFYTASAAYSGQVNHSGSSFANWVYGATGGGSVIGSIAPNGTTAVSYNTTSDYRLKNVKSDIVDSVSRVKALKPIKYEFKSEPGRIIDGFLAHELQEVVPEAVTGEKDAVNADGSIKAQQIDVSYIVPVLTAALKEALARIETLEAKLGA